MRQTRQDRADDRFGRSPVNATTAAEVCLHTNCERRPRRLLAARIAKCVVASFSLHRQRAIEEVLDAAARVETEFRLGVVSRRLIGSEMREVNAQSRANEGVPLATFPVVGRIEAEGNLL